MPVAGGAAVTGVRRMRSIIEAGGRMRGRVGKRSNIFSGRPIRRSIR